jgi:Bacterial TSP3 repeat
MNKTKQWLGLGLSALSSLTWHSLAQAKSEFPSQVQRDLGLAYEIPCSVCHIAGNVGSATPITSFALSLSARGMKGDSSSLSSALFKLEADSVDSDGDGTSDIAELRAGTDPNSSANASIVNDQEPGYGCGGSAPHGRSQPGMAGMGSLLSLAWFVLRRRRGRS